jgi:hypothetical protein
MALTGSPGRSAVIMNVINDTANSVATNRANLETMNLPTPL